jgi:inhibitor of KinA sporulation pathway (predicted exonuclease)
MQTLVMQDRRVTVWELVEEVGISTGSVHFTLTDYLAMWRVCAKFMPQLHLIPCNWFKLSWPNTTFLWFDKLPTLLTWLLAIFGSSPT